MVFDGTQPNNPNRLKLFINNLPVQLSFTGTIGTNTPLSGNPLKVGDSYDSPRYFNGIIDDVRIYNRALSDLEIGNIYYWSGEPISALPGAAVGHWSFNGPDMDFSAVNEVIDQGSGGNDGNLVNMNVINAAAGARGQALSFNGTDNAVEIGNVGSGIKTVAFRMKADDTTDRKILDFDGSAMVELNGSSQIVATNFPGTTAIYVDGIPRNTISDTYWHHVVITDTAGVNASDFIEPPIII